MKKSNPKISMILFLTFLTIIATSLYAPSPTSRNSDRARQLVPTSAIMSSLMHHMTELVSSIESYLVGSQKESMLAVVNDLDLLVANGSSSPTPTTDCCDQVCEILKIVAYDSSYTGGLPIFNLGGPNHNNTDSSGTLYPAASQLQYWNYPLIISDSDTTFAGVNVIKLQENIVYKPANSATCDPSGNLAAIIINKDNMIIDLSGFSLILDDSLLSPSFKNTCPATTANCATPPACTTIINGIMISPGVKNTQIVSSSYQNSSTRGTITDFNGFGIVINGNSASGSRIDNTQILDININHCFGGISAQYASDLKIQRTCTNNNCAFSSVYGMKFQNISNLFIADSESNGNSSCGNVWGMYLQDTINAIILNSQTSLNLSEYDGSAYGIYLTASSATTSCQNKIKNCQSNKNTCSNAAGAQAVGIYLGSNSPGTFAGTFNNVVEKCTAMSNSITGTTTPPNAYGIKIENSNYNEILKNNIGLNGTTGIFDTLQTFPNGSTSAFTSNVSFFNGYLGANNYSIFFLKNLSSPLEPFKATILYASNLQGINTTDITLGNLDLREIQ